MNLLKQSTAFNETFFMVDSSDGKSAKTGLTITATLSKNGAAFGAAGGAITEIGSGWYYIALTTTDTGTLGDLAFHFTATGADPTDYKKRVFARIQDDFAFPNTSGRGMVVDAAGLVDATTIKVGPTGSGTAQTSRDIGLSVLLSSGTGTGQLDFTSGVVKSSLVQILGTALTETSGQIAAAFKKFFDKATPTGTINSIPDAVAGATGGLFIAGTNAATTVTTALTTTFTGNLTGSVASVTGAVGSVTGAVGSVTGLTASDVGAIKTKTDFLPSATAGAAGGVFIAGTNAATTVTTALTTTFTGNLTGSVGSVTGLTASNLDATISSRLAPTVASRTLDVSATGEAGVDWANIGSPTTVVALSGTTVKTATDVETDTQDIQGRLPAALSSGNMKCDVLALSTDSVAADNAESFFDGTGYAGTNNVIPVVSAVTGLTASRLDATISSRASQTSVDTVDDFLDTEIATLVTNVAAILAAVVTEVADIKAKTDQLTFTNANELDSRILSAGITDIFNKVIETGYTFEQCIKLCNSILAGKLSGGGTATETTRDLNDTKDVAVFSVTAAGDRTAVVRTP